MEYRKLGRTGLKASVIGFGAEWIGKMEQAEVNAMAARGAAAGVNIVDCWMSDPAVRSALGEALEPTRDQWIIQGHIGSTWQDGQYVRTRELNHVRPAFEDLLARLRTDHVELGMIHYVDACDEFRAIMDGPFIEYVRELLAAGKIGHIGLSTHNPEVALLACDEPEIEVIMFSLNPAFDMMPASEDLEDLFGDYENVAGDGIEPVRARLYARAEEKDVALTVMKGYAGGRLLSADASPFGVALSTRCSPRLGAYGRGATKALAQLRAPISPVGHEGVHERFEAGAVAAFQQVAQLVHHHVLQALGRIERQTHVDADAARGGLAAAPAAGHVAVRQLARLHAHDRLPGLDERGHAGRDDRLPLRYFRRRGRSGLDTGRLRDLPLLALYPVAFLPHELPDGGERQVQGRRHLNAPVGRLHPQVHVLDGLAGEPNLQAVDKDELGGHRFCRTLSRCCHGILRLASLAQDDTGISERPAWPGCRRRCGGCRTRR